MSRFLLVAVAAIAIIAAITNPKKEDHRDVLKRLITSKVIDNSADESSSQTNLEVAGSAIAMTLGMKAIDVMLESIVSVDSYVFFSLTRVTYQGDSRIIGIGAFDNVWISSKVRDAVANGKKIFDNDDNHNIE